MLLPLQGAWIIPQPKTQGDALGYVLLGFQPARLPKSKTWVIHYLTVATFCVLTVPSL